MGGGIFRCETNLCESKRLRERRFGCRELIGQFLLQMEQK